MAGKSAEKKTEAKSPKETKDVKEPKKSKGAEAAAAPENKTISASAKKTTRKKQHSKTVAREDHPCQVSGCKREYRAKGYCTSHYRQWRQGEFGVARYKTCKDKAGCRKPLAMNRHGYCEEHFQNYYVKGNAPTAVVETKSETKKEEKVSAAG